MPGVPHDERFADFLAGRMTPEEARAFARDLDADDRTAIEVWEKLGELPAERPSPLVRRRFEQLLRQQSRPKVPWIPWAMAAAVFLGGFFAGRFIPKTQPEDVTALRQEVQTLREAVIVSMLRQDSASDRLKGVLTTTSLNRPEPEVTDALMETLRRDPNVNVRLAAVDALKRFSNLSSVRSGLANSLSASDSPLVQIALIDALVETRDRNAVPALRQIGASDGVEKLVKERARLALERIEQ
jgi:HEAT repeat protein